ncbi:MAG: hypothetical protein LUC30_01125 [Clostridiales bacterium]|nr:hypothetical protein [Clostridiales bacterium]
MTDAELLAMDNITARDASEYLHISPQGCRALARSGRIGEPVGTTNRVIYQPYKMIRFKRGDNEEQQMQRLAELLEATGVTGIAAQIATAIIQVAQQQESGT